MADESYWTRIRQWADENGADGCSMATGAFVDCCLEHDLHYRTGKTLGGQPITRKDADERFRSCMQRRSWAGYWSPMAWIRWTAVRLGGSSSYKGVACLFVLILAACSSGKAEQVRTDALIKLAKACSYAPAITAALNTATPGIVTLGPEAAAAAAAAVAGQAIASKVCVDLQPVLEKVAQNSHR